MSELDLFNPNIKCMKWHPHYATSECAARQQKIYEIIKEVWLADGNSLQQYIISPFDTSLKCNPWAQISYAHGPSNPTGGFHPDTNKRICAHRETITKEVLTTALNTRTLSGLPDLYYQLNYFYIREADCSNKGKFIYSGIFFDNICNARQEIAEAFAKQFIQKKIDAEAVRQQQIDEANRQAEIAKQQQLIEEANRQAEIARQQQEATRQAEIAKQQQLIEEANRQAEIARQQQEANRQAEIARQQQEADRQAEFARQQQQLKQQQLIEEAKLAAKQKVMQEQIEANKKQSYHSGHDHYDHAHEVSLAGDHHSEL
jgi:hypothetical protein